MAQLAQPLTFDLETGPSEQVHHHDPGFIRIVGTTSGVGPDRLAEVLTHDGPLVAHNAFGFDFHTLTPHGFDILAAGEADRLIDTMVLATTRVPLTGKPGQNRKALGLDALGESVLGIGKAGDLKAMARKHGGFDKIPLDDPDYLTYCQRDVEVTEGLLAKWMCHWTPRPSTCCG